MSKDASGSGLLSKVVKFVRNPTTDWADLDQPEADREGVASRLALKEMIERKKRNDFVRKREFDMLRKIRRKEMVGSHDAAVRPSFFQSSLQSRPDGRASTLKKIDEIEAQMSMHWWKSRRGDAPAEAVRPADAAAGSVRAPAAPPLAANDAAVATPVDPAAPVAAPVPGASRRLPAGVGESITDSELFGGAFPATPTPTPAIEVEEFVHDPELEEAAIRFANGDDAGAEACLLEAIGETGLRSKHLETWMSLFDLYRATGQRASFEKLALDFLVRFDRSAPQWFSMPDMVSQMSAPQEAPLVQQAAGWTCPAVLDEASLATLTAVLAQTPSPWRMDWGQLTRVDAAAVPLLRGLLDAWASEPVQLQFTGAGPMDRWLEQATPPGDRSVDPACWLLRMAWLRATHRDDDFELAALNYCVTYEVSPPAWETPRCDYRSLSNHGSGETIVGQSFHDTEDIRPSANEFRIDEDGAPPRLQSVELAGRIMGDASDAMDRLEARLKDADVMLISCTRLIRVDFPAAGSLLNWVDGHQASGRQIQFSGVHRLVAVFFHVIGISQLARVMSRTD